MRFEQWPSQPGTPPGSWTGLVEHPDRSTLNLPRAVEKQVTIVERSLRIPGVHAVWLSGSAVRQRLRRSSDIDWVIVTELTLNLDGWPTGRHSFQTYGREPFLRSVSEGHEFSVWQLAYGHPVYLSGSFRSELLRTRIAESSVAVRRKLSALARRRRLIQLLIACGAFSEVRREILLLMQQQLRVEILQAGYVPGCRAEIEQQLAALSPPRLKRWHADHSDWITRLGSRATKSTVIAAAGHYAAITA